MHWIAPSERDTATDTLEKRLWNAADQFRANSGLTAAQYSAPVLGLIFLLFAETRFAQRRAELLPSPTGGGAGGGGASRRASRADEPAAYHAEGVIFLPPAARFAHLLKLPEGANVGQAINDAMAEIEKHNPQLAGVLPRTYQIFTSTLLKELLKKVSEIPVSLDYDAFGRIYEYFLGEFARTEGQKGGEFYTPSSIVRLLVEVIEPFHGRILDPACGSGGMFVQSARFVSEHKRKLPSPSGGGAGGGGEKFSGNPADELLIHGVEKTDDTGRLARMNLAIHGLEGDIRHGGHINSYYDDPHEAVGKFDFVLANPPFNVNAVDKDRLASDVGAGRRFPFGLPRTDNANMLWIQLFYSSLNAQGRAGFVMANSASDARSSEQEIRRKLIEARAVDVMVAVGPNMFYTVTLPCTLWFMDKAKAALPPCPPSPQPSPISSPSGRGRGEGAQHGRGGYAFQGLVEEARTLREKQTPAEEALWELLRNRKLANLKFRRQHQIGDYIVDFFCAEHGLVVELDGSVHQSAKRQEHDAKRDSYLRSLGHTVLRFENAQVFSETEVVLQQIIASISSPSGRGQGEGKQNRANTVLFIDARHIYRQIDRAHRDWADAQIGFIANIVRLYRNEAPDYTLGGEEAKAKMVEIFASPPLQKGAATGGGICYRDIPGLCKAATLAEIEVQGWSLNPGRYVGVAAGEEVSDEDFKEKLEALNEELEVLNAEAHELEQAIAQNVAEILEV